MRITFLLGNADASGGVKVVATHARFLKQRGHQVCIVSRPLGVTPLSRKIRQLVRGRGWPKTHHLNPRYVEESGVDHHVLDTSRPIVDADVPDADVVIATWWESANWAWNLSPAKGVKVHFIQGYEIWGGPADQVEAVWRLPIAKIAISKWLIEIGREKFGVRNIAHVPNGVDMTQFNAPPRSRKSPPIAGMLYNSNKIKGADVALAAYALARKKIPQLRLLAYGREEPIKTLPLPPGAEFQADPPAAAIVDIYRHCDVWVCGSRSEGFYLPMLEAMACRCPVVATKVGGPVDVIADGGNGFLVDIEDVPALADRLLRVLELPDETWRAMSDAAHATACRYTWQEAGAGFEAALLDAVAAKNAKK